MHLGGIFAVCFPQIGSPMPKVFGRRCRPLERFPFTVRIVMVDCIAIYFLNLLLNFNSILFFYSIYGDGYSTQITSPRVTHLRPRSWRSSQWPVNDHPGGGFLSNSLLVCLHVSDFFICLPLTNVLFDLLYSNVKTPVCQSQPTRHRVPSS